MVDDSSSDTEEYYAQSEALMSGESKIISGLKNKIQLAMSNVMPGSVAAKQVEKQMEPSEKAKE